MYTITKEFRFEAAHRLLNMPEGHQCARLHGHSYRVEVELQAERVDGRGFVADYGDLAPLGRWLDWRFDHRTLLAEGDPLISVLKAGGFESSVVELPVNPSAENLAEAVFLWCSLNLPGVVAVRVYETAKTMAEYRP